MSAFVFLDRDGTLVRDPGYVHRVEDLELLPGVAEGLRRLMARGFRLAIITNQSGIGRGHFLEADFSRFQDALLARLEAEGVVIEATFHCPHPPEAGCGCRKPAPGLLEQARDRLGARLCASWMIGDAERDARAAAAAGLAGAVWIGAPARPLPPRCLPARDFADAVARLPDPPAGGERASPHSTPSSG